MCKLQGFKTKICTFSVSQGNFNILQKVGNPAISTKKQTLIDQIFSNIDQILKKSEFQGNSTFPKSCDYTSKYLS